MWSAMSRGIRKQKGSNGSSSTVDARAVCDDTIFEEREEVEQEVQRCVVRIYKLSAKMQRCPYIYEMKERLLGDQQHNMPEVVPTRKAPTPPPPLIIDYHHHHHQPVVGTVVKLNSDGYGSHTSPTHNRTDRAPLMACSPHHHHLHHRYHQQQQQHPNDDDDDGNEFQRCYDHHHLFPKNAKTSLFIIMSFVYMKLLVVVCVAYVISDVVTHNIPLWYYEGFFTYLYGVSILFLLYVFCFLLQESACCNKDDGKAARRALREKTKEAEKERRIDKKKKKKEEEREKAKKAKDGDRKKEKKGDKRREAQYPRKMRDLLLLVQDEQEPSATAAAVGSANNTTTTDAAAVEVTPRDLEEAKIVKRKRKTTQNDHTHGSFFLRIGAIAFGLGTMIYNGLEFGTFFEVPISSPCYMILRGVNPVLQMVFTFMQMYFIFMNSRLNIHRFKVIARFGLMHVVATNICVWIRTVVLEYLKEVTIYHKRFNDSLATFPATVRDYTLRNANTILGTHLAVPDVGHSTTTTTTTTSLSSSPDSGVFTTPASTPANFYRSYRASPQPDWLQVHALNRSSSHSLWTTLRTTVTNSTTTASTITPAMTSASTTSSSSTSFPTLSTLSSSMPPPTTTILPASTSSLWDAITSTISSTPLSTVFNPNSPLTTEESSVTNGGAEDVDIALFTGINGSELLDNIAPQTWWASTYNASSTGVGNALLQASCDRINIMGTIVSDSAPYLFPFIIEYSLIGAVVIYVMWRHIGRNPRYYNDEDLEHRLEVMLSRRAVAMAHAHNGRVDCIGASKGLFFGLLLLVGSLICLILFFVLIHHPALGLLAIYLADVSHCALMALSICAIAIGFCRVQTLRFKVEETSDLNDLLLRISAFGLFVYATFGVIAGAMKACTHEPNLLVFVTGVLSILQVVLQLLFIADVSRRRVHLPEHDRSKPGRQIVTFLLICNVTMWIIYTFEAQKVEANPIQLEFYGFLTWALIQRLTLPLCIFHRFHSAVTLAEIWKTSYKARLE